MKNEHSRSPKNTTEIDQKLGFFIKEKRKENNLSQTEVADMIGVTFQRLQKYESGVNRVTVSKLIDLCKALNLNISSFFNEISNSISVGVLKFSDKSKEGSNFFDSMYQKKSNETKELLEKWNKISKKKDREVVLNLMDSLLK